MNALVNKVQLIGRLGGDPKISTFGQDNKLARFSLATSEGYKNKRGEWVDQSQWHQVVAWGPLANLTEKLLQKGQEVLLEGKLVNRSWEDKDGNKRFTTEVQMNEFFLTQRKAAS